MSSRTLEMKVPAALEEPANRSLAPRATAFGIDLVIVGTVSVVASIGAHLLLMMFAPSVLESAEKWAIAGVCLASATVYFVGFWTREGSTPGQHMMGLRVAPAAFPDSPGPMGAPRAIVRFVVMVVSSVLVVDFIVAFLHRNGRAFHDLAAGTVVVTER